MQMRLLKMRSYTETHEWVEIVDGIATVGLTQDAVKEVGDIVYVELPIVGKSIKAGQEAVVVESTKAAVDIASPVSGTIVTINDLLKTNIKLLNQAPESAGWLFQVKVEE